MNHNSFKEKVEQGLEKLDKQQLATFSRLCAVRALPYIGSLGSFDFWNTESRQKHIYSVLKALDSCAYSDTPHVADAENAANAAYAVNEAVYAENAAASIAYAAYTAYVAYKGYTNDSETRKSAENAAIYAADIVNGSQDPIQYQLLEDLSKVSNYNTTHTSNLGLYGSIWTNFQKALEAEGCSYWGKLYKNIFDNGFALDTKALERRMNVPRETQEKGAAAVGAYLEALEQNENKEKVHSTKSGGNNVKTSYMATGSMEHRAPMLVH